MEETVRVELNLDKARRWLAEYKAVQSYDYDQQRQALIDRQRANRSGHKF